MVAAGYREVGYCGSILRGHLYRGLGFGFGIVTPSFAVELQHIMFHYVSLAAPPLKKQSKNTKHVLADRLCVWEGAYSQ